MKNIRSSLLSHYAVLALLPLSVVACKQKQIDPKLAAEISATQAQADSITAQYDAISAKSEQFQNAADSLSRAKFNISGDASRKYMARLREEYQLSKFFSPEQIDIIKKCIEIREPGGYCETQYKNVLAGNGTLKDVSSIMIELSADQVEKCNAIASGIFSFEKKSEKSRWFDMKFANPRVAAAAAEQKKKMKMFDMDKPIVQEAKDAKVAYDNVVAQIAANRDSVSALKPSLDVMRAKRDSIATVLSELQARAK